MLKKYRSRLSRSRFVGVLILINTVLASATVKGKILHSFTGGRDGATPLAGLALDAAGNLYGTASEGGANDGGVVFELVHTQDGNWKKEVLYSFCSLPDCGDGKSPHSAVIPDAFGNLFGTTFSGGWGSGVVFKLSPDPSGQWREKVLYSFCSVEACADGANPEASLTFDEEGNLLGTTLSGGDATRQCGVVFKLIPGDGGTWTESVLHSFTGNEDGRLVLGPVSLDSFGNIYGTAYQGGNISTCAGFGCGVVFQLVRQPDGGWLETVLYTFLGGKDGANPAGTLSIDASGNIFGTGENGGDLGCQLGGGYDCGVVFELSHAGGGWQERSFKFEGWNGMAPLSGVVLDAAGNLYGTTLFGGGGSCTLGIECGVVFKLVSTGSSWTERFLPSLRDDQGSYPRGGVVVDSVGNLYGTSGLGGLHADGAVFQIYAHTLAEETP